MRSSVPCVVSGRDCESGVVRHEPQSKLLKGDYIGNRGLL